MKRMEFMALNQAYNAFRGRAGITGDMGLNKIAKNPQLYSSLQKDGYLDEKGFVTNKGLNALKPYKVDNAVILAAGSASRYNPI